MIALDRRRLVPAASLVVVVFAACGGSSLHSRPATVTLEGTVTAAPTCPVERQGDPCPPAPVAGTIEARDANGRVVASGPIAGDGSYSFGLQPGTYTLHVVVPAVLPRCPDTPATVTSADTAHVFITCDSGIR